MKSKFHSPLERPLWVTALATAGATVALGIVVLLGWYTDNRTLIQVLPTFVPMQYNTALGFVFAGVALLGLLFKQVRLSRISGGLLLLVGGLTLVQYVAGISLGIDELFMKHEITVKTSHPGRMAPNTAVCFTLLGLATAAIPHSWKPARCSLVRVILGSLSLGLAIVALSGYFTQLETAYGWGNLTRMAVHTSAGIILASIGLIGTVWRSDLRRISMLPRWLPIPTFIGILTATLCLWQALASEGARIEQQFGELGSLSGLATMMLIVGVSLAAAMATVAWLALTSGHHAREVLQANRALEHARETTLNDLMESVPYAMIVADTSGRICRVNSAAESLFGYTEDGLRGKQIESLLPEGFRGGHQGHLTSYFENPQVRDLGANLELFGQRKDGFEFPLEIGLSPFHEPEGMMAVAAIRDITKRKEAEAELAAKEQRFRTLVANLPETVYRCLHDSDRTMLFLSDDVKILTGFSYGDLIQNRVRSFGSVIHADDRDRVEEEVVEALSKKEPWEVRYRIVRRDGQLRWVGERGRAMFDEGGEIEYLDGVIADITVQKELEEQLELAREQAEAASRTKSEFLSSMSHELRTPLNGILGYAQIMQRDVAATDRQRDNVDSIINCGDHLLALINDVLDLSKIEAGRMELELVPCDLAKLVQSVSDIVGERARSKGLEFIVDVAPEVPHGIIADTAKLRQCLVNLLGNAVKFTAEGSVTLRIVERPGQLLVFEVCDTGVGMDTDELGVVFDPFKQVEAGKAAGGTGLGLAITKRLIDKMGGEIEVDSEKGRGSRFGLVVPFEEVFEDQFDAVAGSEVDYTDAVLVSGQSVRLLVADDRETNRDILEQMLQEAGFDVQLADDGDTALEALRASKFDLLLLDIRMPRLGGIETIKQIRKDEHLSGLPVIAVTASVFPEFRKTAIATGFDDFLPKPFRISELMLILKRHLDVEWEALEPQGDTASEAASQAPEEEHSEVVDLCIPAESLDDLRAAFKIKNISALKKLAEELGGNPESAAAGEEIGRLVRQFDFSGLETLIERLA